MSKKRKGNWNAHRPPPGTPRADLSFLARLDGIDIEAGRLSVTLEGQAYFFEVRPKVIDYLKLSAEDVGKSYRCSAWPRTTGEGRITEETCIHWMSPSAKPMPEFPYEIVGLLQEASRDEGLLRLHIPLREESKLTTPFTLTVLVTAEQAGQLEGRVGQKVRAIGVLRKGKRLVATKAHPVLADQQPTAGESPAPPETQTEDQTKASAALEPSRSRD